MSEKIRVLVEESTNDTATWGDIRRIGSKDFLIDSIDSSKHVILFLTGILKLTLAASYCIKITLFKGI